MGHRLAPLFAYDHLPGHLQAVSKPFADHAAVLMNGDVENGHGNLARNHPETINAALWKLWEAKNLAVMAAAQDAAP